MPYDDDMGADICIRVQMFRLLEEGGLAVVDRKPVDFHHSIATVHGVYLKGTKVLCKPIIYMSRRRYPAIAGLGHNPVHCSFENLVYWLSLYVEPAPGVPEGFREPGVKVVIHTPEDIPVDPVELFKAVGFEHELILQKEK